MGNAQRTRHSFAIPPANQFASACIQDGMIKKLILSICLSLAIAACESEPEMSLESLIERHTEAKGGADNVGKRQSVRINLQITEPEFTVRGVYLASRRGFMRIDIYAGDERVFTEALNPEGGWQLYRGESAGIDLSPDGEKALKRGLIGNLHALYELPDLGYELQFIGLVSRGDADFWQIDITAPDGFTKHLLFDQNSYLLVRELECSALHPDIDSTEECFETIHSDIMSVEGITYSRRSDKYVADTDVLVQTTVIENVEINPDLVEALFDRP